MIELWNGNISKWFILRYNFTFNETPFGFPSKYWLSGYRDIPITANNSKGKLILYGSERRHWEDEERQDRWIKNITKSPSRNKNETFLIQWNNLASVTRATSWMWVSWNNFPNFANTTDIYYTRESRVTQSDTKWQVLKLSPVQRGYRCRVTSVLKLSHNIMRNSSVSASITSRIPFKCPRVLR